jgi:hypothetical protein
MTKLTGGNGEQRNCRPVQRLVSLSILALEFPGFFLHELERTMDQKKV